MITQPKKWPGYLAAVVLAIYTINNPEGAAALINKVVHAVITLSNGLGG